MAKKYIDADRLKFKIKNRIEELDEQIIDISDSKAALKSEELLRVLDLIDSLQQEQPKGDLAVDIEMEWDSFNKNVVVYGEESEEVVWLNWLSFVDVATYFYELGLNARKEE